MKKINIFFHTFSIRRLCFWVLLFLSLSNGGIYVLAGNLFSNSRNSGLAQLELSYCLFKAIRIGDQKKVEQTIAKGVNINQYPFYIDGKFPLHEAARYGNLTIVRILIEKGADPNLKNRYDDKAIHYAAKSGHIDVVDYLLTQKGGDIHIKGQHDWSLLHHAVYAGHLDMVYHLVEKRGADVNALNEYGYKGLDLAVFAGYLPIVEYLFPLTVDKDPSLLKSAALRGNSNIVRYLLAQPRYEIDQRDDAGSTALHYAAWYNHVGTADLLLSYKPDPRIRDYDGKTALDEALCNQCPEMLLLFYTHGIGLEQLPKLHQAALQGDLNQVTDCLEAADENHGVNAPSARLLTPLHLAAYAGHFEVVCALLQAGAYADTQDFNKTTPLHFAAQRGHTKIMAELLAYRACLQATNQQKETPLHVAARYHQKESIYLLLKAGATWERAITRPQRTPFDYVADSKYGMCKPFRDDNRTYDVELVLLFLDFIRGTL